MNGCKLYLVRHGESEHNRDNIVSGHVNPPLTATGRQQALETKRKLAAVSFDDVYSSDLERAIQTAEIIYGQAVPIDHRLPELRERNFGRFEGKPNHHLKKTFENNQAEYSALPLAKQWTYKHAPGMESDAEVAERFVETLVEIARHNAGKTILVAAHGGTLRTTLIKLGYATSKTLPGASIANAAFVELDYADGEFHVGATDGVNTQD